MSLQVDEMGENEKEKQRRFTAQKTREAVLRLAADPASWV
jgi:hypothetical protein